jgi:uncharacterized protein (DUF1697 family)
LLRAVNVGRRKVPMAELRNLAAGLGWRSVSTLLQSGNLLFDDDGADARMHEARLERALQQAFGFPVPTIVRTAGEWHSLLAHNPFPDAAHSAPRFLMLFVSKEPPAACAEAEIGARLELPVRVAGGSLWVRFRDGRSMGTVKLPWDRLIGSAATSRNWSTAQRIGAAL